MARTIIHKAQLDKAVVQVSARVQPMKITCAHRDSTCRSPWIAQNPVGILIQAAKGHERLGKLWILISARNAWLRLFIGDVHNNVRVARVHLLMIASPVQDIVDLMEIEIKIIDI
jgi:hypothetical protein